MILLDYKKCHNPLIIMLFIVISVLLCDQDRLHLEKKLHVFKFSQGCNLWIRRRSHKMFISNASNILQPGRHAVYKTKPREQGLRVFIEKTSQLGGNREAFMMTVGKMFTLKV
jgi:hypothetical protein